MSEQSEFSYRERERGEYFGNTGTWVDQLARAQLFRVLDELAEGEIRVDDPWGTWTFTGNDGARGLRADVTVHDARFYRRVLLGGSLGAGEAYMEGWWSSTDLTGLIRLMARNRRALALMEGGLARIAGVFHGAAHWWRRNTPRGSRRNIEAHYDLSNDFFALFLDPAMMYSSGYFETPSSTMEEASTAKLDRLCRALELAPDDHVLEIGTGWGGFALHAARNYGCRVTTTTISKEQYALARKRVAEAGLDDRITLLMSDYRDLKGQYDKLVSIEMIEAVGHAFLGTFLKQCGALLKPNGRAAIQAITIADQQYDAYRAAPDFINRYIFPGGCLPSVAALCEAATRDSDLRLHALEEITPHYAETLLRWRERFFENIGAVRALGFTERFIRMWEYYLCYCEAGFRERSIGTVQVVLTKPGYRMAPITSRGLRPIPRCAHSA